tara:strand:- start:547 stop:726 length:180 start_codon:yes stop_codon:yes gene_type:complete
MKKEVLQKIIGYIIIMIVVVLTIKLIKFLPIVMKLLALAANVLTVYFAYNYFINKKNNQ